MNEFYLDADRKQKLVAWEQTKIVLPDVIQGANCSIHKVKSELDIRQLYDELIANTDHSDWQYMKYGSFYLVSGIQGYCARGI